MEYWLFLIPVIYAGFLILIGYGLSVKRRVQEAQDGELISVIVPYRNEEKNLSKLVSSLEIQSHDNYEVIFVNDNSTDDSVEVLKRLLNDVVFDYSVIQTKEKQGKKAAIELGIAKSRGEKIATTDADCWMGKDWLVEIDKAFSEKIKMVVGPVALKGGKSLFTKWQALEFSTLIGTGAAMIKLGMPLMCNGANLAYRKSAFNKVGGFNGIDQIPTGDDELLMYKFKSEFSGEIAFLDKEEALVYSSPINDWNNFVSQRKRWSSKWKVNRRLNTILIAMMVFLFHLNMLAAVLLASLNLIQWKAVIVLLLIKVVMELAVLLPIRKKWGLPLSFGAFFASQIFYPFYAIYFGLVANFGRYDWKGRTYNV